MMNRADDPDDDQQDRAGGPQDVRDGEHPVHEVLDVDDVADRPVRLQDVADHRDPGRFDELDLEAGEERVALEVLGEVLTTLRLHRFAEAHERVVPRDVDHLLDLGHGLEIALERFDLTLGRVGLQVRDDLDLLLRELQAGQQSGLDDPEPGEQEEHQDHRRGRGEAHDRVAPEALPGPPDAEDDERDHRVNPRGGRRHRPRRG